ncbi:MAG: hypothetical protein RLZZ241_298 [Bacteroidota bacterium]|jgi:2-keto-4-pentenoate hydratase/2-oxohepta-3-ene-1,7-dioic acid hydratase in catechol pathway
MKLITYRTKNTESRTGWLVSNGVVDMQKAHSDLPTDMLSFIDDNQRLLPLAQSIENSPAHYSLEEVQLLAPLPNPRSFRDYIGFEQHMLNASKSFGHQVGNAWYEVPIFYFTNHHAVFGPEDEIKRPDKETKLDLETEMAVIIGKKGSDIKIEDAHDYIFGYTVFNDWTARAIQKHEMTVPLGPHKGKDFANAIGPCIVTKDEFESKKITVTQNTFPEHLRFPLNPAHRFNLKMEARINGKTICEGNYSTVYWTFPQMMQRASENGVTLMPGDIIGSGTVGWGSLIENNFSVHRPIEPGDVVEIEIEGIGVLRNKVV